MSAQTTTFDRSSFVFMAICAFACLYVFPYQPKINNPNENVRFYMTAALVENNTYQIDAMRERWGWVNDAARSGGHLYSVKAPGTSLLGVPGYAAYFYGCRVLGKEFDRTVALWICRLTASILPTLVWLFFLYRWFGRQTAHPAIRDSVVVSIALGSLLYGYATMFVSHTLSAVVGFGAFMLLYDARRSAGTSQASAFGAGMLTASATLFEYPGLVASVLLSIYGLFSLRSLNRLAAFACGGLLPTLLMMHFQWRAFGSPFTPGHLFVENPWLRAGHHQGFYGAGIPTWEAFFGLVLDPAAGMLPLTPILLFAPIGLGALLADRKNRLDATIVVLITVFTLLAICSMNNWRGGWTIGPRYLAIVVPFLAWGSLEGLKLVARRLPRLVASIALGCAIASLLASGAVSAYYPHLPPELTRPLPQLLRVLVKHDFAPFNAASFFGLYGTASMWPLYATALFVPLWILGSVAGWNDKIRICAGSIAVAVCVLWPLLSRPDQEAGVENTVAFITRSWTPEGHDAAARLRQEIEATGRSGPALVRRLADIYLVEGRRNEALMVLKDDQTRPMK